ncbi:FxsA family protein [Nocardia speluncae]|uniref:FxsA family protein n=1 Tax=Nocardia speluncae TaxID=419477 RepID=A0A846XCN1_9NOCA|nr:FxsA family protein [Nocardia speluncae]NKY32436.1 FxsA family protein [Nocardia speluncae]
MPVLGFIAYLVVEIAVFAAAVSWLGAVPAILLLIASSAAGMLLLGSQWRRVGEQFRRASRAEITPGAAVADGALVAFGSVLMFVPGLVSSVVGLLMLLPPTRALFRPVLAAVAARRVAKLAATMPRQYGTVVDADIVDGVVVDEWYTDEPARSAIALEKRVVSADGFDAGPRS